MTVCAYILSCFNHVQLFVTSQTVAHQAPLSMGFPRQGHWSGLPCPPLRDLPDPRTGPASVCLLHRQADSLSPAPPGKSQEMTMKKHKICSVGKGRLSQHNYTNENIQNKLTEPLSTHKYLTTRAQVQMCREVMPMKKSKYFQKRQAVKLKIEYVHQ